MCQLYSVNLVSMFIVYLMLIVKLTVFVSVPLISSEAKLFHYLCLVGG